MKTKITATLFATVLLILAFCTLAFAQDMEENDGRYAQATDQSACYERGDVDGNKKITAADSRIILRAAVGLETLRGDRLDSADTNLNKKCDAADARTVLRISVGLDRPLPHAPEKTVLITASTCFESGRCADVCEFCEMLFDYGKLPPTEHVALQWETIEAPTCNDTGYARQRCLECDAVVDEMNLPKLNHVYGEVQYETAPDCYKYVNTFRKCTLCNHVEWKTETPTFAHSWFSKTVKEPTCTEDGEAVMVCLHCKQEQPEPIELPNLGGHRMSKDWQTTVPATCITPGEKVRSCLHCLEILETETVAPLGHKIREGSYVRLSAPTCTGSGEENFFCTRCMTEITQPIAPLGHTPVGTPRVTPPTCTNPGAQTYTCSVCDEEVTLAILPTGHSETYDWKYNVETNEMEGYCKICHELADKYEKV